MKFSMKRGIRARIALLLVFSGFGGCAWVTVSDAGALVQQADAAAVVDCARIGFVTAQTRNKMMVERSQAKIDEELLALARNEAALLGGDTIVAAGTATDGRGEFEVYLCNQEGNQEGNQNGSPDASG